MMAGWAKVSGAEIPIDFDFKNIGKEYTDNFYKYLRFLVSFFGALFPLVIYFFTKELFRNKLAGFLAGFSAQSCMRCGHEASHESDRASSEEHPGATDT